jgi:hypothetical protein
MEQEPCDHNVAWLFTREGYECTRCREIVRTFPKPQTVPELKPGWTTGLVRCHDCNGTQIWKIENGEIVVFHGCFNGNQSRQAFADIEAALTQAKAEADRLREVLEAARCIRHWHDSMRDGSGMVVSAAHVRKLWEAIAKYDAALALPKEGQP